MEIRVRVSFMSARSSLRGSGDTLSRRLASSRSLIVERGKPSWTLSWSPNYKTSIFKASLLPRVFAFLRSQGVSVVHVQEFRTYSGCRVSLGTGVEWLLLSKPVLISHER